MSVIHKFMLGVSAIVLLSAATCSDVSKKIVNNAPPARTPILKSTERLFSWNGDPTLYFSTHNFEATVRVETNVLNRTSVSSNGSLLPEFDGNNPANGTRVVYTVKNLTSPSGPDFSLNEYRLFYPTAIGSRLGHGTRTELQFIETSLNPQYAATPSSPLSMPIIRWDKQCIVDAEIDNPVRVGDTKVLRIKGKGCKRIQIDINGRAFQTLETNGPSTESDDRLNVEVRADLLQVNPSNGQRYLEFKITGTDPIMRTLTSYAYAWEQPVTICPTSASNPTGQPTWYPYCVACPSTQFGWFVSDGAQQACSRDDATAIVQNANSNCSVSPNLGSQFAVCTQCTGQSARRDLVGACTQAQALEMTRAVAGSGCVVSACP